MLASNSVPDFPYSASHVCSCRKNESNNPYLDSGLCDLHKTTRQQINTSLQVAALALVITTQKNGHSGGKVS